MDDSTVLSFSNKTSFTSPNRNEVGGCSGGTASFALLVARGAAGGLRIGEISYFLILVFIVVVLMVGILVVDGR